MLGKYRLVALDLAVWFCTPAAFLLVYVYRFGLSGAAVLPHLRLVFAVFCALAVLRAAATLLPRRPARVLKAVLLSAALATLLAYYGLVLIGLQGWGRVITWDLIVAYAGRAVPLAQTLGVSLWAVAAAAAGAFLVLLALAWLYVRSDWTSRLTRPAIARVLVYGSAFCVVEWMSFVGNPPAFKGEPISLTFFHERASDDFEYLGIDIVRAQRLDRLEDEARALYRPGPDARRRNVILIVVDSLRADHLSIAGYARDTTPNLKRLAARGLVRTAGPTYAACSHSACALYSLIASKYVHEFSLRPFTLHEALRAHGYRTHLILSGDHVNFYGLKDKYGPVDSYFDGSMAGGYADDDEAVLTRTRSLGTWDGAPVLMQFHLMSAHALGRRQARFSKFQPSENYWNYSGRRAADAAINYYDNGVLQTDAMIHELLEILLAKGYLGNALVVITGDHGEALGERGEWAHANGVDDEVLRIPLVLLAYGYRPPEIAHAVIASQVDIAPTILGELAMPLPSTWSGMALQSPRARSHVYFHDRQHAGFIDQRDPGRAWKYSVNSRTGTEHAFDLAADPRAELNAIDKAPPAVRAEWRSRYSEVLPVRRDASEAAQARTAGAH